jgi:tetratricopeptide (TPR) repeat protein
MRRWGWRAWFLSVLVTAAVHAADLDAYRPRFEEAERLYRLGQFDDALARYETLAAELPDVALAHIGIAQTAVRLEFYGRAIAALKRAHELAPDNARVMGELGDAFRLNKAYDDAATWYLRALDATTGRDRAEWLVGLGFLESVRGNDEGARVRFVEAVSADPSSSVAYHNLGVALLNLSRYDEADAAFRAALEREPKNARAFFGRGRVAEKQGRLYAARDFYTRATELASDEPTYHYARAIVLRRLKQTDAANEAFAQYRRVRSNFYVTEAQRLVAAERWRDALAKAQKAYETDADNPDAVRTRAYVHARLGEWDAARASYERLLALEPTTVEPQYYLGLLDIEQRRYRDAERRFQAVLDASPDYGIAYRQLARARELNGDLAGAESAYDSGIRRAPDWAAGYWWRGQVRVRQGRVADAERDFRRAVELAPDVSRPKHSLARLLAAERRSLDEARELAESAFRAEPSPSHRATRALVLYQRGECDTALREATQALADAPDEADVRAIYDYILGSTNALSASEALR